MESSELQRITNWLIDGAWSSKAPAEMTAEACERMVAAGLPLWRFGIFIRTLHPEIFGRNFIWREGEEVEIGTVDFEILETPEFARSPLRVVFEQGLEVRGRMDDPGSKHFRFSTTCVPKA
jgi:adenylate cyclase